MNSLLDTQIWRPIIDNARDVLKIDICVVDTNNLPIYISKSSNHYGSKMSGSHFKVRSSFKDLGNGRWEYSNHYGFLFYALEIKNEPGDVIGFIVLGPVILSKRLATEEYRRLLQNTGENSEEFIGLLEEIRNISNIQLDAILNTIEALLAVSKIKEDATDRKSAPYEDHEVILNSIFQVSLAIANAESGSLMIFDEESKDLLICTAKGINNDYLRSRIGLDDSVSGRAFKEQKSYILKGILEPAMPKHFLNRIEIQESIVMPFGGAEGKVRGVLNLNYTSKSNTDLLSISQRVSQVLNNVLLNS